MCTNGAPTERVEWVLGVSMSPHPTKIQQAHRMDCDPQTWGLSGPLYSPSHCEAADRGGMRVTAHPHPRPHKGPA